MYHARHLSPMILSFNIPRTVSFFTDLLDVEIVRDEKTYVILEKDNQALHILQAGDIGEMEFYLEVDDVEAVTIFNNHLFGILRLHNNLLNFSKRL